MTANQLLPINIVVADRTYRLRIKAEEEENIRRAIKEANNKILEFKTAYAGKDMQDYIAMCLITYATQSATPDAPPHQPLAADWEQRLQKWEAILDKSLE